MKKWPTKADDSGVTDADVLKVLCSFLVLLLGVAYLIGCSSESAKANGGCVANEFSAPSGAKCYVIECNGNPVGGNCN